MHDTAIATAVLLSFCAFACDKTEDEEESLEASYQDLRERALAATRAAQGRGEPKREAWMRAVERLRADVTEECPPEALAAPRLDHFAVELASPISFADVSSETWAAAQRHYGYPVPDLAYAGEIFAQLNAADVEGIRRAIDADIEETPEWHTVCLAVERLIRPEKVGEDHYRPGELLARAYLLDAQLSPVCSAPIRAEGGGSVRSFEAAGIDTFEWKAVQRVLERAQTEVDARFPPHVEGENLPGAGP